MIVLVDIVHLAAGSVCTANGLEERTGDSITFGMDTRMAYGLIELAERMGEPVPCEVEGWQVLERGVATVPVARERLPTPPVLPTLPAPVMDGYVGFFGTTS